jgi:hypothetical protein
MSIAFVRQATVTASTKRPPAVTSGLRAAATTNVSSLKCTPLDPVDPATAPDLRQRLGTDAPHELLQTFVDKNVDIREGDILVVGSVEYPIKFVSDWVWRNTTYRHLILEELK